MDTEKQVPILGPETAIEMLVSNDGINFYKRYVLFLCNGFYVAVNDKCEDSFLHGGRFTTSKWTHAKPIPEKKWRQLKLEEVTAEMLGCRVYNQHGAFLGAIRSIHFNIDIVTLYITDGCHSENRCLDWLCESECTYELNGEQKRFAVEVTE
jgi:hypothetical protein